MLLYTHLHVFDTYVYGKVPCAIANPGNIINTINSIFVYDVL